MTYEEWLTTKGGILLTDKKIELRKDGKLIGRFSSENEALKHLHNVTPYSWDSAFKYEGWSLTNAGDYIVIAGDHGKGFAVAAYVDYERKRTSFQPTFSDALRQAIVFRTRFGIDTIRNSNH